MRRQRVQRGALAAHRRTNVVTAQDHHLFERIPLAVQRHAGRGFRLPLLCLCGQRLGFEHAGRIQYLHKQYADQQNGNDRKQDLQSFLFHRCLLSPFMS